MNNFFIKFFATGFGVGYIPKAPGTFATLSAAAIWWYLPDFASLPLCLIFIVIAFLVAGKAEKLFAVKDDQRIVIDEFAGYFVAVALLPKSYLILFLSIILFRFFDIKKPFFIKSVQKYKSGFGVIADDIISGIITNLILQILQHLKI